VRVGNPERHRALASRSAVLSALRLCVKQFAVCSPFAEHPAPHPRHYAPRCATRWNSTSAPSGNPAPGHRRPHGIQQLAPPRGHSSALAIERSLRMRRHSFHIRIATRSGVGSSVDSATHPECSIRKRSLGRQRSCECQRRVTCAVRKTANAPRLVRLVRLARATRYADGAHRGTVRETDH